MSNIHDLVKEPSRRAFLLELYMRLGGIGERLLREKMHVGFRPRDDDMKQQMEFKRLNDEI